jgi:large subunit ribosomal protein L13
MKTTLLRKQDIKRNWWVVDASGKILGRLATKIAYILMGKHKRDYTPYIDNGDFVVVINAEKIMVTGKKLEDKIYYHHTGYLGHLKSDTLGGLLEKHPERVIMLAVKRMLPKNKLQKKRLKRLKIYAGPEHPHSAQLPKQLEV